jgi:hypothetical protein
MKQRFRQTAIQGCLDLDVIGRGTEKAETRIQGTEF